MIDLSPVAPILFAGTALAAIALFYGLLQLPKLFTLLSRKSKGNKSYD